MAGVVAQFHQEIDRVLKQADLSVNEFSNCCQHVKVDVASRDIHGQRERLRVLSGDLQQHRSQLLALSHRGSMRKPQKEKLEASRTSIDLALANFRAFEHDQEEKQAVRKTNSNAHESSGSEVEASEATMEAHRDVKVQVEQLQRDTAHDSDMLEEFICKICQVHVVGSGPKLARCSHLFCGDCIAKWFEVQPRSQSWAQRAQSGGLVPCPVCKEPLHRERDLFSVCPTGHNQGALLWRLLSGVKIVCANNAKCRSDGKCDWIGELGSYQKHLQTCANIVLDIASSPLPAVVDLQQSDPSHLCETCEDNTKPQFPEGSEVAGNQQLVELGTGQSGNMDAEMEATLQLQPVVQQKTVEPAQTVVRAFLADGPSQLSIKLGEAIQVLNQHPSGWTYGRIYPNKIDGQKEEKSAGWFPNWAIA